VEVIEEPGVQGELALRPGWPSMFRAYWNEPERYRKCFAGGWYLTGDLAKRDRDGYFWFVGRKDDVINTSGHLIGPFEVESVLMEHPAVAEAGVIGKPDPVALEVVKAFVSLKGGHEPSDELRRDLLGHARKRLGAVVAPKEIAFVPTLPKNRGKIMRRLLRPAGWGCPRGYFDAGGRPVREASCCQVRRGAPRRGQQSRAGLSPPNRAGDAPLERDPKLRRMSSMDAFCDSTGMSWPASWLPSPPWCCICCMSCRRCSPDHHACAPRSGLLRDLRREHQHEQVAAMLARTEAAVTMIQATLRPPDAVLIEATTTADRVSGSPASPWRDGLVQCLPPHVQAAGGCSTPCSAQLSNPLVTSVQFIADEGERTAGSAR
jgi:hypothetical protein